ncbi:Enoyl-CoA hydratase / carnithine racemase [Rhodococcus ruber BKS 20-38]|uniref:Enoyl-CoA hydratase / carnithine racemase n=1 Tax=Rhodococcus ruber BKS 20-38 TaxID=1278076 RepID=M2Y2M6_9NOCA|nr:enoyl-CoA hydratase/isomerase family protein [Rhodococcus ruber]EME67336.1 Enoyl-CoA hydratase / carnithine racemase [Rhodococcus ruber BKS 20-38]
MYPDVRTLTVADLADGAAHTPVLGDGAALSEPVLLVDLDDADAATATAAAARVPALDRLLVGRCTGVVPAALAPLTAALDLTYAAGADSADRAVVTAGDLDAAVGEFVACVGRFPQSALVAGQVLRISETLPVPEAIDVESLAYSTLQGGAEFSAWLDERRRLRRSLPPPAADPVLLDRDGDTLTITLNRPERRNAYGTALRDALVEALRLPLLDDTITTVVLDGAGPSFCAGGDLDEFGHTPDTATAHLIRTRGGAARLIAQLADRTTVHLHGHCVGAGIEIPAFAHRIVATPDTLFRLPEVTMGLIPGAGGTVSVPRRIGRWRALHLFVTGTALDAKRALEWGLINEIVEVGD